jgi:bile acid:Na+ symporter, BASS family
VFSPWMNISGSILANFWRKHPVQDTAEEADAISGIDLKLGKSA